MLTVCGFIEQENWMYTAEHDDDVVSHTSACGALNNLQSKLLPASPWEKEEDVSNQTLLKRWDAGDLKEAKRCQEVFDSFAPDSDAFDYFFSRFHRGEERTRKEIRKYLTGRWKEKENTTGKRLKVSSGPDNCLSER